LSLLSIIFGPFLIPHFSWLQRVPNFTLVETPLAVAMFIACRGCFTHSHVPFQRWPLHDVTVSVRLLPTCCLRWQKQSETDKEKRCVAFPNFYPPSTHIFDTKSTIL